MAREAKITPESVAAVADAMKAEGIKPTTRGVRLRLGNKGSMGSISAFLHSWKVLQDNRLDKFLAVKPAIERALLDFSEAGVVIAQLGDKAQDLTDDLASAITMIKNGRERLVMIERDLRAAIAAEGVAGSKAVIADSFQQIKLVIV